MKIVVDDKIPYILEPLKELAEEVVALPGRDIRAADVRDADILVVRTRTRCDKALLEGSSVRLVLTATIGFDHLDVAYLHEAGIEWHNCPGCNATSVAQYVRNSLLALEQDGIIRLDQCTLGIVGVGHVGTAVLTAMQGLVKHILLNDPPRESRHDTAPDGLCWSPLTALQAQCDIITLHTPLVTASPYPTLHLADSTFLNALQRPVVFINAGRGEVAETEALLQALADERIKAAVIDTWEHEPAISRELLEKVYIGTPHIAGYSADGKANATRMVLEHICRFLGRRMDFGIAPPPLPADFRPAADSSERHLQLYDPRTDSTRLKAHPELFEQLRGNYPLRREDCALKCACSAQ